jgi:hypothetical protein
LPNRSTRDDNQEEAGSFGGTLHRFAQSLGLSPADTPEPPAAPAATPAPASKLATAAAPAANALQGRQTALNKAIDDAS